MKMVPTKRPRLDLKDFLELILMWHTGGNVPRDRLDTQHFIEDEERFHDFLQVAQFWCNEFGLKHPSKSEIVRTLHDLYVHPLAAS